MQQEWYIDWFNSPYYAMLYKHRNYVEAKRFLKKIVNFLEDRELKGVPPYLALDIACGDGRHSIVLHQLGYEVIGIDISESKIEEANKFAHEGLCFLQMDMREISYSREFNLVLNLFTSFGYFENSYDNMISLLNMQQALLPNGVLVIDYLNADYVIDNLVPEQELIIDEVQFRISRRITREVVRKKIEVFDNGKEYEFVENVQLFTLQDFTGMLNQAHLDIFEIWGNYLGELYTTPESERLILFCQTTL